MTEFRPGTSPPPVRIPIRFAGKRILLFGSEVFFNYTMLRSGHAAVKQLLLQVGPELVKEIISGVRSYGTRPAYEGVAGVGDAARIPGVGHERGSEGGGEAHPGDHCLLAVGVADKGLAERVRSAADEGALAGAEVAGVLAPQGIPR